MVRKVLDPCASLCSCSSVRSSEHLRLDTFLLYIEGHAAAVQYIQQVTSQLEYDFISAHKPPQSHNIAEYIC